MVTARAAAAPSRLSALDAAFLALETPSIPLNVAGLAVLDPSTCQGGRLDLDALAGVVSGRLHVVPRLRQRLVEVPFGAARPVWADDPAFSLARHLHSTSLPAPGTRRELEAVVARLHARPLERDRPLWDMHLIDGLEGGRAAVLMRMHHAMVDGMGAMEVWRALFDAVPDPVPAPAPPWRPAPPPPPDDLLLQALAEQQGEELRRTFELAADALDPPGALARRAELLDGLLSFVSAGPAPPGPFNRPVDGDHRLCTCEVPAAAVRHVRRRLGVESQDLVLAVVAGGLHRLLRWRGEDTGNRVLRAMVPVASPVRDRQARLGNHAAFCFVDLPISRTSEAERAREIAARAGAVRAGPQAAVSAALIALADRSPPALGALVARALNGHDFANVVVSYVRGLRRPTYLAGATHVATFPVLPLAARLGLFVGVCNLGGTVGFGLTADAGVVPDLEALAVGILEAFAELAAATGAQVRR